MEITLPELRLQLKEVNKQLDKLLLLGSNDESIVEKKRALQKQIRNLKKKQYEAISSRLVIRANACK